MRALSEKDTRHASELAVTKGLAREASLSAEPRGDHAVKQGIDMNSDEPTDLSKARQELAAALQLKKEAILAHLTLVQQDVYTTIEQVQREMAQVAVEQDAEFSKTRAELEATMRSLRGSLELPD